MERTQGGMGSLLGGKKIMDIEKYKKEVQELATKMGKVCADYKLDVVFGAATLLAMFCKESMGGEEGEPPFGMEPKMPPKPEKMEGYG
jgi:hypothetical protein